MNAQTNKLGLKLELGGGVDVTKYADRSSTMWQLQVSPEYRFSKQFAAGVGIGVTYNDEKIKGYGYSPNVVTPTNLDYFSFPVYAHATYTLPTMSWKPFVSLKAGYILHSSSYIMGRTTAERYPIQMDGGAYLSPSIGVKKHIVGNQSLLLSLSYEMQDFYHTGTSPYTTGTNEEVTERVSHNNIVVRVGWEF